MSYAMTAQELLEDLQTLPATERGKSFLLLESRAFQDDNFTHEQVFGHLATNVLTVQEAAEYLEMSVPNFRGTCGVERLRPFKRWGAIRFATRQLKAFKRTLRGRR